MFIVDTTLSFDVTLTNSPHVYLLAYMDGMHSLHVSTKASTWDSFVGIFFKNVCTTLAW